MVCLGQRFYLRPAGAAAGRHYALDPVATSGVILFGIALVFTFNALVSMLQFVANEDTLRGLVFWTMGSIDRASWQKVGILLAILAVVMPLSMRSAWKLTALRLGEDRAVSFGINVRRLRLTTLLRISVLSAISVAFVGPIGFIGLGGAAYRRWFSAKITALPTGQRVNRRPRPVAGFGCGKT